MLISSIPSYYFSCISGTLMIQILTDWPDCEKQTYQEGGYS